MVDELKQVTLSGLGGGAAEEIFSLALKELLSNAADINTPWKARRRVSLTFDLVQDENRRNGKIILGHKITMPEAKPFTVAVRLGMHQGAATARGELSQEEMFNDAAPGPRAVANGESA